MSLVTVVAIRDFTFQERTVHRGEAVELQAVEASIHARLGHVSLDRDARPTYQTRDMVAVAPPVVVVSDVPEQSPVRRRRRRRKAS